VHAADPAEAREALARFVEPRYLHQVRAAPPTRASKYHHSPEDGPLTTAIARPRVPERPTHVHETADTRRTRTEPIAADDLPEAFDVLPADRPWRVHFHIPLHATPEPPLAATTDVLAATMRALYGGGRALSPHVEVETYTWGVLPEPQRPAGDTGLVAGIAAELRYARDLLVHSGVSKGD
jgi:hypothetical protein